MKFEDALRLIHPEVLASVLSIEDTLWPTIRCDFFLRFRSKKTPPLSAFVMYLVEAWFL